MSTRENFDAQREARAATATHSGGGLDLRSSAMMRYVAAMTAAEDRENRENRDDLAGRTPADRADRVEASEGAAGPAREATAWAIGRLLVEDVMTTPAVSVRPDTSFKQIAEMLLSRQISSVPVVDDAGRVLGVVSASDLFGRVVAAARSPHRGRAGHAAQGHVQRQAAVVTAAGLMSQPALCVPAALSMVEAARRAADAQVRRMPVVNEAGILVGILTRSDLLRVFLRRDDDIRDHIANDLVAEQFCLDPTALSVSVHDGVVSLRGQVEHPAVVDSLVDAVRTVVGVVEVDSSQLTSEHSPDRDPATPMFLRPAH